MIGAAQVMRSLACGASLLAFVAWGAHAEVLPVALVSVTDRVAPGGTVELVVEAEPGAVCEGNRQGHYSDAFSIHLPAHTTGPEGRAQWQWSVLSGARPIGIRRIRVTCTANGRSGGIETSFTVR